MWQDGGWGDLLRPLQRRLQPISTRTLLKRRQGQLEKNDKWKYFQVTETYLCIVRKNGKSDIPYPTPPPLTFWLLFFFVYPSGVGCTNTPLTSKNVQNYLFLRWYPFSFFLVKGHSTFCVEKRELLKKVRAWTSPFWISVTSYGRKVEKPLFIVWFLTVSLLFRAFGDMTWLGSDMTSPCSDMTSLGSDMTSLGSDMTSLGIQDGALCPKYQISHVLFSISSCISQIHRHAQ